jgi:hypothetical protein
MQVVTEGGSGTAFYIGNSEFVERRPWVQLEAPGVSISAEVVSLASPADVADPPREHVVGSAPMGDVISSGLRSVDRNSWVPEGGRAGDGDGDGWIDLAGLL